MLEEKLIAQGLSQKEAQVYLALLQLGPATASQVADKASLKRTTVYNILPQLCSQGYIVQSFEKKKRIYYIEDVHDLEKHLEEKRIALQALLPELEAMHCLFPHKPKVRYYEGVGGLRDFYLHTLDRLAPGEVIREYFGTVQFEQLFPQSFAEFYQQERARRKIPIKVIAADTSFSRTLPKRDIQLLRETIIVPRGKLAFSGNLQMHKNHVAIISFTENFMGIVIESKEVYQMQKACFDMLWQVLHTA